MNEQDNEELGRPDDSDEADEQTNRPADAVDALGGMAPGEKREASIDALAAMAAGEAVAPAGEDTDVLPADSDQPAEAVPTEETSDAAFGDLPTGDEALQVRLKRASTIHQQTQRAHAEQFKQFMIPMLIVTGGLLFILATVVALTIGGPYDPGYDPWYQNPSTKKALVLCAYPLGAILGLGAWLFYTDIQRYKKK